MKNTKLTKLILSALFLAFSYVLPFFTGQIPEIGAMLCPMHIPVLLCGYLCGPLWGMAIGFIAPLFRSLTLGMPPLFPSALCMAFELLAYGGISGLMHKILPDKKPFIYCSLLIAMVVGRVIWGCAMVLFVGISGGQFTFTAFIAGAVTNAIPGIILQILLVPALVMILQNQNIFKKRD